MIAIQLLITVWIPAHLMSKSLVVSHSRLLVLMMVIIIPMDHPHMLHTSLLNSHLIWLLRLLFILNLMRLFPWSVASLILPLPVRISNHTFNLFINRFSIAPSKLLLRKHHQAIIISMVKVPTKHHKSVVLGLALIIRISTTS